MSTLMRSFPFFKTLQEHFEGIQKALTKEVKEMSDAFVELETELDQSIIYEMQKAHNVVKARCLDLEAELLFFVIIFHKVEPKVLATRKLCYRVEVFPSQNRNNRDDSSIYLRHLEESVDTLREIVEEAKIERPLDRSLASACRYTKHSQELLEYVFGTCPKVFNPQDKKHVHTPRKKQVTFTDQIATSSSTTHKHVEPMHTQKSNVPVALFYGVYCCTDAKRILA
ncbi:hypothetical protein Tco_0162199 [Tanacetum coccineum]